MIVAILLGTVVVFYSCSDPAGPKKNLGPPQITWHSVPDSLRLPVSADSLTTALLRVEVSDPDGLSDISSVYFYSRKPDGQLANGGNAFPLNDEGKLGDETANDGIFSTGIKLSSGNQVGTYIFTFYAKDKSGNLSEAVKDSIEVYK